MTISISDAHIKDVEPLVISDEEIERIHTVSAKTPAVLLPYQQEYVADSNPVVVVEKSRRTGLTWGEASDDTLLAATKKSQGGQDVLYLGYELEMTREYIATCAFWAKHFSYAVKDMNQFIFLDSDKNGETREIKAFRIDFASGNKIVALSSAPRSIRGRQGRVVIDEAAFHDNFPEVLKAALALLMWGGSVRIISTHDGDDNPFNQLIQDVLAGKYPYSLHKITFTRAVEEGLCRRIFLVTGKDWSPEAEAKWVADIRAFYGDNAEEELDCIPCRGGGTYLIRTIIESCMHSDIPVIRWAPPAKDFVDWDDEQRHAEVRDWRDGILKPLITLIPDMPTWFGEDFGRDVDLTVIWPIQRKLDLVYRTPFVVELRDCPFTQQEQILYYLIDDLPQLFGGALDKGGNGAFLAERAKQHPRLKPYGHEADERVKLVHFCESFFLETWPRTKNHLEDGTVEIPADSEILDDFRAVRKVKGVPKIPDKRTSSRDGGKRHGDAATACNLALYAARTIERPQGWSPPVTAGPRRTNTMMRGYRI